MSIYKRGKSWYIDIRLGGIRINRAIASTKNEARTIEAELKTKYRLRLLGIRDIQNNNIAFDDIAQEYLQYIKDTKSSRTYELESTDYKKHIQSSFGNYPISDIDNNSLFSFQARQKTKGYANRTVNIHIGLIRKIINFAKDKDYIGETFKLKYPMLEETRKLHAFLSPEEFKKLSENITYDIVLKRIIFARNTGLRPSELAYLTWDDIDWHLKTVKIQSKKIGNGTWIPKGRDERIVHLNKEAFKILKTLYKKKSGPWVFSGSNKPVKNIRRALKTAAQKAGIKHITPNMLRHTFACHTLMKGADIQAVKDIMGHKNISTTDRYTHAIKESLKKAVEVLDD